MVSCVGAVIVSAGSGKRLAMGDKAVLNLAGKPLFYRALEAFCGVKAIKEIVLVLRKDNFPLAKKFISSNGCKGKRIILVEGGAKRADSVFKGLSALSEEIDNVLIHDGARPFVSKKLIFNILKELKKYPAVTCGLKCPDTLKLVKQGVIKKTLDRDSVYLIQTPQAFRKKLILKAYKRLKERKPVPAAARFTDDAQILEALGKPVRVVAGDILNFKVTYPEDLGLARKLSKTRKVS